MGSVEVFGGSRGAKPIVFPVLVRRRRVRVERRRRRRTASRGLPGTRSTSSRGRRGTRSIFCRDLRETLRSVSQVHPEIPRAACWVLVCDCRGASPNHGFSGAGCSGRGHQLRRTAPPASHRDLRDPTSNTSECPAAQARHHNARAIVKPLHCDG